MKWFLLVVAAVLTPLGSVRAAGHRSIRLEYSVPPSCPNQDSFEARLAARLGYNPVNEPATHVAGVAVRISEDTLEARFSLGENGNSKRGERSFSGGLTDCDAVLSGVALALAIALDPRVLTRQAPEPSPVVIFSPVMQAVPEKALVPLPMPIHVSLAAGVRGSVGLLPAPGLGPYFEARLRLYSLSLALDGDASIAPTLSAGAGRVESSVVRGGLQLCGHAAFVSLCARGTGGGFAAGGSGFENSKRGWQPFATVGPLVGVGWKPIGGLLLNASVGLEVVLIRNAISLGPIELWNSSVLAGNASVSVGWLFL